MSIHIHVCIFRCPASREVRYTVSFVTVGTSKKVSLAFDGLTVETLYETPVCHLEGVFHPNLVDSHHAEYMG